MQSENLKGAVLMIVSMAAFTSSDTFMKLLADELPLFQSLLWRGVLVSLALGLWALRAGAFRATVAPQDHILIAVRTLADTAAAWFFFQALFQMPIANLGAILLALPLTVTLAAAVFLREPVGWRRMLAILVGFSGVLLIARPDTGGFDRNATSALIAVGFFTLRELTTRRISRAVPSVRIAFWNVVSVMLLGAIGSAGQTLVVPSVWTLTLLSGTAVCFVAASLVAVMAMRHGELGFVMPYRYTSLIWALILGLLVFDEWPDALTMAGAALIVGTGMFTFYRERLIAARLPAPGLR